MLTSQKIILSADELTREELVNLVSKIGSMVYGVKVHNLYDLYGAEIIGELKKAGAQKTWVDFKLHDIPNTVKLRAEALAKSGCDIITVQASGGVEMMSAAKQGFGSGKVYAVTALTSLSDENVKAIYNAENAADLVTRLAPLIKLSGVDGLVCSPKEISLIRNNPEFNSLELAVPGIRSVGVSSDDQKRFDTPANALKFGANYLVMGRQITKAVDPVEALKLLEQEITNV